jgi:phosphatidylinositol 4-kinase type 2
VITLLCKDSLSLVSSLLSFLATTRYNNFADYLMLNTDRGADNYMVKYCEGDHEKSLVDIAPTRSTQITMPSMSELRRSDPHPTVSFLDPPNQVAASGSNFQDPHSRPHIHIAAIDNSLSFPHEHPQGWRSYTYGWLYLPVSVIGRPFSEKTRNHFLPLLTSKAWWEETTFQLRNLFAVDPDFHPKMFSVSLPSRRRNTPVEIFMPRQRQLAVIKGQAWNIVQSLRHSVR